jgi:hypothetical protein
MKILLTGMASSHVSPKAHSNNFGFFAALNESLTTDGHDVTWGPSSVTWDASDLDAYDAVFVGVVPPTAISANRAYGALNVIQKLFGSKKLYLVIDSPQYWLLEHSLASIVRQPEKLVSAFYNKRAEYSLAISPKTLEVLVDACQKLLSEKWPTTLYPSLPWKSSQSVAQLLPSGASDSVVGINFDSLYITKSLAEPGTDSDHWTVTESKGPWALAMGRTIRHRIAPVRASKADTNDKVSETISGSIGVIITPQRRKGGTWWSFVYAQAMNELVPVVTEWRESSLIGQSWNVLASEVEDMTPIDRYLLAIKQREDYLNAINSNTENSVLLESILGLTKKEEA